jgi:ribonuclease R
MEFSVATLLSYFSDDKLVAPKHLEKKLGCEDEVSLEKLQIVLDALERIGILAKERGKYRRIHQENFVEAKLRCSSKGFCFAIQDLEDADDIYVRESHLSNAWNGDRVLVKIIKEGTRRRSPEGEVKLILERANPSLLAQVKRDDGGYQAVPLDDRLLFELDLKQNGDNLEEAVDHLVHVSVLRYPIGENRPLGKVTRVLGSDAEEAADIDIVCCKHDLLMAFAGTALEQAVALSDQFEESERQNRLDLRDLLTFTLEDAIERDHPTFIEQAWSLETTDNGCWQLGVHITDVDYYLEMDSPLDKAGKKRGTTIFLRDKVLPLYPDAVTNCCSLKGDRDCLTVSVLITLDEKGNILQFEIQPSVIRVSHQLTYQDVQAILNNVSDVGPDLAPVAERLKEIFFTLCPLVKAQRLQRGSFEIQLEKQLVFKDEGRCGCMLVSSTVPVRSLLSELAVLVGKVVADHLLALNLPAIYCTQPEPDWEELEDLLKLAHNLGLDVSLSGEDEVTPQDYQNLTQAFSKSPAVKVLNFMLYNSLKQVKYSSHPAPHFGLAYQDAYTHCISPGQRYSDLLIQRVLKLVFAEGRDRQHSNAKTGVNLGSSSCHGQIKWNVLPPKLKELLEEDFHTVVSHLNDRDKVAEDGEKDLEGLKKAEKMKERTGKIFRGLITGVQSYGFFVEIEDLLVEGLVHVSSLKDDWYEYRARHSCLVGRKNRIAYRLGDEVEVEVKNVDYYRQQIDLVTIAGGSTVLIEDLEDD